MSRSEQLRQYLVDAERAGLLQPSNGHHPSVELPEEISRPGHRPTTQRGNAERLVDSHGHELRWVAAWGWLRYRDGRWQGVHDADVEHLAGEVVRGIYGEAAQEPDSERRKSLAAWAPRSESQGQITAMVQLARGFVLAKPEDFDRQLTLFNVANGTIDLTTGELLLHNPDDMLAKMSPVVFYPEATCPQWMRFLERVLLRNPDIIPYLQQMVGYSMTGLTTEQVLLLLWGLGANGKRSCWRFCWNSSASMAKRPRLKPFYPQIGTGLGMTWRPLLVHALWWLWSQTRVGDSMKAY